MSEQLFARYAMGNLLEAIEDTPVILIHGARQCGKTTLAKSVGEVQGYTYITFDDENQLAAAKSDPVGFVKDLPEKTILDEIQRVPELFLSIKDSVDSNRLPGRFILTGSANVLLLPQLSDSLAGRMEIIHLRPLAQCEISGHSPSFLEAAFLGNVALLQRVPNKRFLGRDLAEILVAGGYPSAIHRKSARRRNVWYRDYIATILQRDIKDIARIKNVSVLPKILALAASQTGQLFNASELASPLSISRPTVREYLSLLAQIFLIEELPPWHSNRISRLIKTPKLHLSDTGLACSLLGVRAESLWEDKTLLGQLLETFIYQELRKQASWHHEDLRFYHFRNKDKIEVDIVIEKGRLKVGVEIKASATVKPQDFKGLNKLKDACDEDFAAGIVVYDGEQVLSFGERLYAVPISHLI